MASEARTDNIALAKVAVQCFAYPNASGCLNIQLATHFKKAPLADSCKY
jgi:hypothetical protein